MKIWATNLDFGTRTDVIKQIKDLCENYSDILSCVILFGSTARNEFTDTSDIDLYIESDNYTTTQLLRHKSFDSFTTKLYNILDFSVDTDLLSYGRNELNQVRGSSLYSQVTKDGVVLYDTRTKNV